MALTLSAGAAITMSHAADRTDVAGCELFRGSEAELLDAIDSHIADGGRHLVITPNVDQVLSMRESRAAAEVFRRASIRLVDGAPLIFLARALGDGMIRRITGADLLPIVVRNSTERGWRVAITGGSDSVIDAAIARFAEEYPGACVRGVPFPHIGDVEDERGIGVVRELEAFRPDIVFLCLGFPKQEGWFLQWESSLPSAVYVGAGASVDFAARTRSRAPGLVQSLGLEWVWRLVQEPRRLAHRYIVKGPGFLRVVVHSLAQARRASR
jgi:N-acetylglucosaminyldiphosphoundecaprenol N-acetyl-beta-D-mannosaminyltransferase